MDILPFKKRRLHSPERSNEISIHKYDRKRRFFNNINNNIPHKYIRYCYNFIQNQSIKTDKQVTNAALDIQRVYRGWKLRRYLHIYKFHFYTH